MLNPTNENPVSSSSVTEEDEKMDVERVLNDIDYAANKGECFLKLNKEFSI